MATSTSTRVLACFLGAGVLAAASAAGAVQYVESGSIPAPAGVTQLVYAPGHNLLVARNAGSALTTFNVATNATTLRLANVRFTDIAIAPGGNAIFAADYGGENIGSGSPAASSYVHRLDPATMTWETKSAYIAYQVQPVSDTQVLLKSIDQWVSFTNNAWSPGPALTVLNSPGGVGPAYYAVVYYGDFRYVPGSGRLLHGNSGSSSQEIVAFRLVNNEFVRQEETGIYGSAQGYGGTVVLATDGSAFYYGRLQVDPLDVRHTTRVFPEPIHAATGSVAFGSAGYYDAKTGQMLGTLGFAATIYALNPNGKELWVYDAGQGRLRRFVDDAAGGSACGSGHYPFPYADLASTGDAFCPGILQAYVLGVTKGTSATTFTPEALVSRVQMTTFLQRTFDQAAKRASRRGALNQWWSAESPHAVRSYPVSGAVRACASDGEHVWLPAAGSNEVLQVQASTGRLLGTWTGAIGAGSGALVAAGRVFVAGQSSGALYAIDPAQAPGPVTQVAALSTGPGALAFDGARLWSANASSVSIVTLGAAPPYAVTTIGTPFSAPTGFAFDGVDMWMTDRAANKLYRLDVTGGVLQTVGVGISPRDPAFDGANLWVPNAGDHSITVVDAATGAIVATIKANPTNRLDAPTSAAFDGERVLVTSTSGNVVSVFRAANLAFVAAVDTGASSAPQGACSDGAGFWVGLPGTGRVLRYQ